MRVVVVGSGAREHALAHVLGRTAEVIAAPGNPGIADERRTATPPQELDADLFVIGPEVPLVGGLADQLRAQGKRVFGPGADGAQFEGSKTWMKRFFVDHDIPTARHASFDDASAAIAYLQDLPSTGPYVVKADGPAAGKGVAVLATLAEAEADVRDKLEGHRFGAASNRVVIEEFMGGPEVSIMGITDGTRVVAFEPAQDFKTIGEGHTGPMTGGMGAYSPVPVAPKSIVDEVMDKVFEPTVAGLRKQGIDYRGVLYAGLMLTENGTRMLEYNVRFGDPEAEVLLPRFDGDLADFLAQAADGHLRDEPRFVTDAGVTVIMATDGYPTKPRLNDTITGIDAAEALGGVTVFHAGTARSEGRLATAGGRVLAVTALGPTIAAARERAYEAVDTIEFAGKYVRRDIAQEAASQEAAANREEALP